VVVGADPKGGAGRGVVTAATHAARKYGIRSALPISRAWRLAEAARRRGEPEAVFVRDNRQAYREASTRIMALIADGVDAFEEASIDEAYVYLSSLGGFDEAEAHARALKARVREREELTCSVGLGPNKLVAKIATVVRPDDVLGFLGGLRVRVIPGIGPKTEAALGERGIATVADLRAVEPARLANWFGKLGLELHDKSRGISDDPVSNVWERKSVGEQETFEEDSLDPGFVLGRARALAAEVFRRFAAEGSRELRTVTVTVRFTGFVTVSRSRTTTVPQRSLAELEAEATRLLEPFFDARENPKRKKIRLIGVRVEKLGRPDEAGIAPRAHAPVPRPSRPRPRTPQPRWSRRHSSGSGETGDESALDRVYRDDHYDRDRLGCSPRRQRRLGPCREDDAGPSPGGPRFGAPCNQGCLVISVQEAIRVVGV
jgi:DNA polymerase IV (DinB-like DNA polymerase)